MKTNPNDNAFSNPGIYDPETRGRGTSNGFIIDQSPGLTKREYFAGLAMQGILANDTMLNADRSVIIKRTDVAIIAIASADALIDELNK